MQAAQPVHSPEVTTSVYRWAQWGFSGGTAAHSSVGAVVVPELPEVEAYRQLAEGGARPTRRTRRRSVTDASSGAGHHAGLLTAAPAGVSFTAARRHGKLLVLDWAARDDGPPPRACASG